MIIHPQVGAMIGNLRNMANDMGQEVDTIIHTTFANYCYHICFYCYRMDV